MSGFEKEENNEGFEEVHMSQSTDEEDVNSSSKSQVSVAVNVTKYDDEETTEEEKESAASSMENVVPMEHVS